MWALARHDAHATAIWVDKASASRSTHKASMRPRDTRNRAQSGKIPSFSKRVAMAIFGFVYGGLVLAQKADGRVGLRED